MADGDRFDPRFDPAFQRGYEDEAAPPVATSAPQGRPAVEQPRQPVERPAESDHVDRPRRTQAVAEPHEDAPSQRRNPFVIAAIVIAGLLILGAILLFARLPEWRGTVQGDAVVDYATLEVLYFATPLMFISGIGIIVAVLLYAAARWRVSQD